MRLRLALVLLTWALMMLVAPRSGAQDNRTRFAIAAPTDTTFDIVLGNAQWVKKGMSGIIVDPRRDFELIGRFNVKSVGDSTAAAVVTGIRTELATHHVALLTAPRKPFFRQAFFWIGSGVGLVAGYFIGKG